MEIVDIDIAILHSTNDTDVNIINIFGLRASKVTEVRALQPLPSSDLGEGSRAFALAGESIIALSHGLTGYSNGIAALSKSRQWSQHSYYG